MLPDDARSGASSDDATLGWVLFERFVRRHDGVDAARHIFARTRPLRLAAASADAADDGMDGGAPRARRAGGGGAKVTPELYLAHAALELTANGAPDVAAKTCVDGDTPGGGCSLPRVSTSACVCVHVRGEKRARERESVPGSSGARVAAKHCEPL